MHAVKLVGAFVEVVTAYPIIPLASSVAFIVIVFVVAFVVLNTSGFCLSIVSTPLDAYPFDCPVLSTNLAYIVPFELKFWLAVSSQSIPSLLV